MASLQKHVLRFLRDERGISVTEYGLLIALIGIAAAAAVKLAGPIIVQIFQNGADGVESQVS